MAFLKKRGCNLKTMIHYYITCQKLYNTHHVCSPRKRGMPEMKENYARPIPGPRNTTKELSDVMDYPKPCVIVVTTTMGLLLRSIYTKVIRPWLLRILEFSLVDNVTHPPPHFRLTWGHFWIKTPNIFSEWRIHTEFHMANMDDVGWVCRGIFQDNCWR